MPPSVVRFVRELRMGCVSSAGDSVPHEQRGVESGADFFRQGRFAFPCPYRKVRLSFFSYTYDFGNLIWVHPSFWCKSDFLIFIMDEYQATFCRS
jgi:hypothetical protein